MANQYTPTHITLVVTPDSQVSPLSGLYETFNAFKLLAKIEPDIPPKNRFRFRLLFPKKTYSRV
jgi:hypothetical protein